MRELLIEKRGWESQPLLVSKTFSTPASDKSLSKTMKELFKNGITSISFDSRQSLIKKLYELIPENAEVMTMTSVTLDTLGISEEISSSSKYRSVRNKLRLLGDKDQKKVGSVSEYTLGSVNAVTENGEILIASATGSQLSAYAYASEHVIWVVGTQKIVKDKEEGTKRIYDYCFPLENARSKKVYNVGSKVGKILTINSEIPGRLTILFLKENIGF